MKLHQDSKRPRLRESRWSTLITISADVPFPLSSKISLSSVSSRASTNLPREVSRIILSQASNNRWLTLITISTFRDLNIIPSAEETKILCCYFIFQILFLFFSLFIINSSKLKLELDRYILPIYLLRSVSSLLFLNHLVKIILPIGERCNH